MLPNALQPNGAVATDYGIEVRITPGSPLFAIELQRAPDNGSGSPNVGAAATVAVMASRREVGFSYFDVLPADDAFRHYRWRHVGDGYDPGAWTGWARGKPAAMPASLMGGGDGSVYPIHRRRALTDGDFAVAAATDDGLQFVKEGRFEGQGRTLLQMLTYEIPNAEFDVWETNNQPHAWTVDTGESCVATKDTSIVFAGDNACKFSFGVTAPTLSQSGLTAFNSANVMNGNLSDQAWHTDSAVPGAWLQADYGVGNNLAFTSCYIWAASASYAGVYDVEYSDNASSWIAAVTGFNPNQIGLNSKSWLSVGAHRYWRIKLTNTPGAGAWLSELAFSTYRGVTTNDPTKGAFCIPLHPGTWYQFKFASRVSSIANTPSYRVTLTHNVAGTLVSQKTLSYRLANKWQLDYFKFLVPSNAESRTKLAIEFTRNATVATDFWIDGVRFKDMGTQRVVILAGGTSWPVSSDWNPLDNKIEAIAGGGGAGGSTQNVRSSGGGGGGGYGYKLNFDPGASTSIPYGAGLGGPGGAAGSTNGTAGGSTTWNSATLATGGGGGQGNGLSTGGAGGGVGAGATGGSSGGAGGNGGSGTSFGGGGGGGAGGPTSAGGIGGNGTSAPAGGSGGTAGTGGGWTDTDTGGTAAVGAGGNGGSGGSGGAGGSYGGGAGGTGCNPGSSFSGQNGTAGVLILSWRTPA